MGVSIINLLIPVGLESACLMSSIQLTSATWWGCQYLVSGLTEAQVLCFSAQKEFSERQRDRQEVDLLIKDTCKRCKPAGEGALPLLVGFLCL